MANRGIEVHNGLVVFADVPNIETRGNPFEIRADQEVIDIDASPLSTVTALGTANVLRLRGNVKESDLTSGKLRVLNVEARAAKDIPVIDAINLEVKGRDAADISGRIAGLRTKMETTSGAGTIAVLAAMHVEFQLAVKPTYAAGIMLESTGGQTVHYGLDMGGTYPLSPSTADIRLGMADINILSGAGAPTMVAPKGSLYLRTDGTTTNDRAYINTDGSTTWTALTTAA